MAEHAFHASMPPAQGRKMLSMCQERVSPMLRVVQGLSDGCCRTLPPDRHTAQWMLMMKNGLRIVVLYLGGWISTAHAAPPPAPVHVYPEPPPLHLYEARVVVTGTDMRSRPAGMAACLRDALVQVSGDPALLADPRVAALERGASALVASYDYVDRMSGLKHNDEQGSSDRPYYLTVRFDPARLDAALRTLGDAPYTGPRPTLLPIVLVRDARQQLFVLTKDGFHLLGQTEAFAAAADRYAMALRLPQAAELTDGAALSGPNLLPVTGTLLWSDAAHGWAAAWQASWDGRAADWSISGVSFDEAFRSAVRGTLGLVAGHPPHAGQVVPASAPP